MKIAIIADTHHGVRNDSPVFQAYIDRFYDEVFFPRLKQENIKTIIHLGDLVDRPKFINYNTLHRLKRVTQILVNDYETHFIAGNHDTYHKSTNDVYAVKELFDNSYNYTDPTQIMIDGLPILFIPWVTKENEQATLDLISKTKAQVAMGHLELSGFEMYRGKVKEGGMDGGIFDKFDLVLSGHYHHKSSKGVITYVGAPYEMNWHDFNDWRGFHILDTQTLKMEPVQNPLKMFHKVEYDETKDMVSMDVSPFKDAIVRVVVSTTNDKVAYDTFCDKIEAVAHSLTVVDQRVELNVSSIEVANTADTSAFLRSAVAALEAPDDLKNRVEAKLQELFVSAQSLEV